MATQPAPGPARPATAARAKSLVRASAAATHGALRMLQRKVKSSMVIAPTSTRQFDLVGYKDKLERRGTDERKQPAKKGGMSEAVEKSPTGPSFKRLEPIWLDDSPDLQVKDQSGQVAWYRVKGGKEGKAADQYIRATKLMESGSKPMEGLGRGQTAPEQEPGKGPDFNPLDTSSTVLGTGDAALLDFTRQVSLAGGDTVKLNLGEGATWAGAGLLGMAVSLRDLADDEKSAWEKVNAYFGLVGGMVSVAGGVSQIVANAAETGSKTNVEGSTVSAWMTGYGDMFAGLANAIKMIKNIVELVKMVAGNERYNRGKGVQLGTELLGSALETGKSVLRSIRGVNEAMAGGTTTT